MSVPGLPSIPLHGGPSDGGVVISGTAPGDTLLLDPLLRWTAFGARRLTHLPKLAFRDQGARLVDSNPEFDWPGDDEPDLAPTPPRDVLVKVLVYHWRKDNGGGCGCGWDVLGASWPEHVADIYEDSLRARNL